MTRRFHCRAPRVAFAHEVQVRAMDRVYPCRSINLSGTGILVIPPVRGQIGLAVHVDLPIVGHARPLELSGRIARECSYSGHYAWGIDFDILPTDVFVELMNLLARIARVQPPRRRVTGPMPAVSRRITGPMPAVSRDAEPAPRRLETTPAPVQAPAAAAPAAARPAPGPGSYSSAASPGRYSAGTAAGEPLPGAAPAAGADERTTGPVPRFEPEQAPGASEEPSLFERPASNVFDDVPEFLDESERADLVDDPDTRDLVAETDKVDESQLNRLFEAAVKDVCDDPRAARKKKGWF